MTLRNYLKTCLFETKQSKQPIYVYENPLHRWLCFDNDYVQTIINKHMPHRPVLAYLPSLCLNLNSLHSINSVVMLGAGAGAIAHYMERFHLAHSLTLVEHNETIIKLAKDYFYLQQPIIHDDAFNFVKHMSPCTHLFIDVFINSHLPELIKRAEFIEHCRLKATHCVSFNLLSRSNEELNQTIKLIQTIFSNRTLCLFIKKRANVIVHAYTQANFLDHILQLTQNGHIYKPQWRSEKGLVSTLKRFY
tara:strand:+ start:423 stop:1166 length:744 start_codon:yes stop_codon:yes gene_type:complete